MPVNENTLEQAIISELQEMGYDYIYAVSYTHLWDF